MEWVSNRVSGGGRVLYKANLPVCHFYHKGQYNNPWISNTRTKRPHLTSHQRINLSYPDASYNQTQTISNAPQPLKCTPKYSPQLMPNVSSLRLLIIPLPPLRKRLLNPRLYHAPGNINR